MRAPSDKYLECTNSNLNMVEIVSNAISTNTPFCISRIGDGEIFLLNDSGNDNFKQKIAKLWGFPLTEFSSHRELFCEYIKLAIRESDYLGVLDFNNEICTSRKFIKHGWSISYKKLQQLELPIPKCCDHQLPRSPYFGNPYNFKNILQGRDLNIITPNNTLNCKKLSNILDANVTVTISNNNRQDLINSLENIDEPVVLYGTSLTGKDVGVLLKRKGKITLDFGATLDGWAGIESRPWFKSGNIQEYCVIK